MCYEPKDKDDDLGCDFSMIAVMGTIAMVVCLMIATIITR